MGNRLSKIYTRTGDDGSTGMADGTRLSKANLLFDVMGDVDELNAHIGMIRALYNIQIENMQTDDTQTGATNSDTKIKFVQSAKTLNIIQNLLFNIGGELAMPSYQGITAKHITWLEDDIDAMNQHLAPLKDFILPTGSILVSEVHISRTICRRAERQAVKLSQENSATISTISCQLLNRLSDWLFVFARICAIQTQNTEVLWDKNALDI